MKFKFPLFLLTLFSSSVFSGALENNVSYERASNRSIEDRERLSNGVMLSPNGKSTKLSVYNKGGYVVNIWISYLYPSGGEYYKASYSVRNMALLSTIERNIPEDAIDLELFVDMHTGLIWEPFRRIFSAPLCEYNNQWSDGALNQMRIEMWGSVFNPKTQLVRSQGTYENGADTSLQCGEY